MRPAPGVGNVYSNLRPRYATRNALRLCVNPIPKDDGHDLDGGAAQEANPFRNCIYSISRHWRVFGSNLLLFDIIIRRHCDDAFISKIIFDLLLITKTDIAYSVCNVA